MQRTSFAGWPCSVARALEILGDPWTPLVLRDAYHGLRRFDDFQRSLGIARNTLADRLRRLVDAGMLRVERYQENPPRNEYVPTPMAEDFFPVMAAMLAWGDRWLADPAGPPVVLQHEPCGSQVRVHVGCASCDAQLALGDVEFGIGPGYPEALAPGVPDIRNHFTPEAAAARRAARGKTAGGPEPIAG